MKPFIIGVAAATLLVGGPSFAQTPTAPTATNPRPGTSTGPATTGPRTTGIAPGATAPGTATPGLTSTDDKTAASGNNNQAVATTNANATQPAKGSNSFTMGEAQSRLEKNGFANVSGLKKDDNGVWRGMAQKDGAQNNVWLDYKGNTGVSQ